MSGVRMTPRNLLLSISCAVFAFPFAPHVAKADQVDSDTIQVAAHTDPLGRTVEKAIDTVQRRYLDTQKHSPWQVMHGLLGLRYSFQMMDNGKLVNGLKWMAAGQTFDGASWFEESPYGGRAHPFTRAYAFQGHANQFLAVISMAGVPTKYKFKTKEGKSITVGGMVENAKMEINSEEELAWTLWALSRYLPPDAEWTNKNGQPWSIEKIIAMQVKKPINGTYCGGTHSLFAMAHARNVYLRSGKKLRGPWLEADQKIRRHVELVREQQGPTGMFSTNFFVGPAYEQDFSKRLASAGHLLEFLMISLSQKELNQRWVRRGVQAVAQDIVNNEQAEAKCGPLYHATNGLVIFMDRTQPRRVRKIVEMNPGPDPLESVIGEVPAGNPKSRTINAIPVSSRKAAIEAKVIAEQEVKPQVGEVSGDELPIPELEVDVPQIDTPEGELSNEVEQDDRTELPIDISLKIGTDK